MMEHCELFLSQYSKGEVPCGGEGGVCGHMVCVLAEGRVFMLRIPTNP